MKNSVNYRHATLKNKQKKINKNGAEKRKIQTLSFVDLRLKIVCLVFFYRGYTKQSSKLSESNIGSDWLNKGAKKDRLNKVYRATLN